MVHIAREAGMAEVAASVLHNVGNVLNSVNISSTLVKEYIDSSELDSLSDVCMLLDDHRLNLGDYITSDPKGMLIPEYLQVLVTHWAKEKKTILGELRNLNDNINHIKNILTVQQTLNKVAGFKEMISIKDAIEEAIAISGINLTNITLNKNLLEMKAVLVDKIKLLQILINVIKNAKDAVFETENTNKIISIDLKSSNGLFTISVADNGSGIPKENLIKIFSHGFTTKKTGHGFGLHASALAAKEMGGELRAESGGLTKGSIFILELPIGD
jgi:C4-dicarboxylate-specific signal transduction histidine kinase